MELHGWKKYKNANIYLSANVQMLNGQNGRNVTKNAVLGSKLEQE